jgi:hypothetical protein
LSDSLDTAQIVIDIRTKHVKATGFGASSVSAKSSPYRIYISSGPQEMHLKLPNFDMDV